MTYPGTKVRKFIYLQNYSAGILLKENGSRWFTEPITLTFDADPTIIDIGAPLLFSLSTITCTQAAQGYVKSPVTIPFCDPTIAMATTFSAGYM